MHDQAGSSAFDLLGKVGSYSVEPGSDAAPRGGRVPVSTPASPRAAGQIPLRPWAGKYHRIQILRFLAAAVVVLFHSVGTSGKYFCCETRLTIFEHGDLGVDLFFVISGFIIFITVSTREKKPGQFLRRRLERIVPLYWIITLVMFVLLNILYGSSTDAPSLTSLLQSLTYTAWVTRSYPIIYPGWTLEYEMAFYLVVAAVMFVTSRTWSTVIVVFSTCVVLGLLVQSIPAMVRLPVFLTNPMYLEFILGIVVGHLTMRRPLPWMACGVAAAVLGWIALQPTTENMWRLCVAGVPAAVIVGVAAALDRAQIPLSRFGAFLSSLGDASYSIYLVQVIAISIVCKALRFVAPGLSVDAAALIAATTTLMSAYGLYYFVERPVGMSLRRLADSLTDGVRMAG